MLLFHTELRVYPGYHRQEIRCNQETHQLHYILTGTSCGKWEDHCHDSPDLHAALTRVLAVQRLNKTVDRRYSDFDPFDTMLRKRFPYRIIPALPPKAFGSKNTDADFLEKRRKGLARFVRNLVFVNGRRRGLVGPHHPQRRGPIAKFHPLRDICSR